MTSDGILKKVQINISNENQQLKFEKVKESQYTLNLNYNTLKHITEY